MVVSIAPHWKTYGIYVNNFKYARDLLFECQEQSEHFRMFLDNNTMKLSMDLNMLLSLPLNHIAGYERILKSILDEESDPTQNSDLLQAILIATETSNFIANALGTPRPSLLPSLLHPCYYLLLSLSSPLFSLLSSILPSSFFPLFNWLDLSPLPLSSLPL